MQYVIETHYQSLLSIDVICWIFNELSLLHVSIFTMIFILELAFCSL